MAGVPFAFFAARYARELAKIDGLAEQGKVWLLLSREQASGTGANVSAV